MFVNWTGRYTIASAYHQLTVDSTMNFTANFRPCYATNKANPFADMELAPPVTKGYTNIAGATYGMTRNGGTTLHNGIDLAGDVGTPIYAQFDGTIQGPRCDTQPNKVEVIVDGETKMKYPADYTGDTNGAGNRIYVDSSIGGNTVRNGYWHLQAGTPIANNPRTGKPWATGDIINAGEVIGYIGITGNASEEVPHLHLNTKVGGVNANPANYLNATVSNTTSVITTPCD
jgi:murein DD-endopeptidase MepM/ murein hydrolase activator NlpD